MKRDKIIYWIATGILCLIMVGSATMYFLNHEEVAKIFTNLGFPTFIIYPLATAKILGVIAILTKRSPMLKEWAYAGFFFDVTMATTAHFMAKDGQGGVAILAMIMLIISYYFDTRLFK